MRVGEVTEMVVGREKTSRRHEGVLGLGTGTWAWKRGDVGRQDFGAMNLVPF